MGVRDEAGTATERANGGRASAQPGPVELHVEELVLDGFEPGDRYRIAQALQRELTRLFTAQGVPAGMAQGGEMASLDAGTFEMRPGAKAGTIGAHVAQAVYGGLSR